MIYRIDIKSGNTSYELAEDYFRLCKATAKARAAALSLEFPEGVILLEYPDLWSKTPIMGWLYENGKTQTTGKGYF